MGPRLLQRLRGNELSSQNISFPSAAELSDEGRTDLVQFADQQVDTGSEAEAYASYINGHLEAIADGGPTPTSAHPSARPRPT